MNNNNLREDKYIEERKQMQGLLGNHPLSTSIHLSLFPSPFLPCNTTTGRIRLQRTQYIKKAVFDIIKKRFSSSNQQITNNIDSNYQTVHLETDLAMDELDRAEFFEDIQKLFRCGNYIGVRWDEIETVGTLLDTIDRALEESYQQNIVYHSYQHQKKKSSDHQANSGKQGQLYDSLRAIEA